MQYTVQIITNHNESDNFESFLNDLTLSYFVEFFPEKDKDININIFFSNKYDQEDFLIKYYKWLNSNKKEHIFDVFLDNLFDKDWQNEWKQFFKPIVLDKFVVDINEDKKYSDKIKILIDPGMAFGNGGHPTTKNCLILIEKYFQKGMKALDFGCGSGILAIACSKLGAKYVDAVDNDDLAIEVSIKNIHNNQAKVNCKNSKHFAFRNDYHFIVANITVDILIKHFDFLTKNMKNIQYFILSGISDFRKNQMDLFLSYDKNFIIHEILEKDGWYTYCLKSKKKL
jgi:ribosomal protein L11 methyltransferase